MKRREQPFSEKWLSFFVPFLGLVWFFKKKNRGMNLVGFIINLLVCTIIIFLVIRFVPFPDRFSYLGKKPLCNLKEERAMHFGSFVFILCYRCTFLILGAFSSFTTLFIKKVKIHWVFILCSVIFIVPCFLDGIIQATTSYVSTNLVRALTGLFAGFGFGYFLYLPFRKWNLFF